MRPSQGKRLVAPFRCSAIEKEGVKEGKKASGPVRPDCEPEAEYPFEAEDQKGGFFPTRDPGNFPSVGECGSSVLWINVYACLGLRSNVVRLKSGLGMSLWMDVGDHDELEDALGALQYLNRIHFGLVIKLAETLYGCLSKFDAVDMFVSCLRVMV